MEAMMLPFMRRDLCPILFTRPMSRYMWPMSLQTVRALESTMQEMQDVPNKVKVTKVIASICTLIINVTFYNLIQ